VLWLGYGPAVRRFGGTAINIGLHRVRVLWMKSALQRDNRIVDSALIGHVVHSASFFTSTSLIAVGALLGVLTGLDRLQPAVETLALSASVPRQLLELKVLLPLIVLVYGLFKLTWSLRQLNYTVALIGAMPTRAPAEPLRSRLAEEVGGVLSSALATFNEGIRSYYFAIAAIAWLAGPLALALAGVLLIAVLLHRQHSSDVSARFRAARQLVEAAHAAADEDKR